MTCHPSNDIASFRVHCTLLMTHICWQTMLRFIKFLITEADDVYGDMPFPQCVHDDGTIQKKKYEVVGLQFIGARYNGLTSHLTSKCVASDAL